MASRTVVFVDAGYLIKVSAKKCKRIDLVKLSKALVKEDTWEKTIFYNALPRLDSKNYAKTQKFHSKLQKIDKMEVRLGRLQYDKKGRPTQKGVDMRIGIDLVQMSMKKEFDDAILITADSDFLYAVQKAQEANVTVRLAYFPGSSINKKFLQCFDGYELLHDALLDSCKL